MKFYWYTIIYILSMAVLAQEQSWVIATETNLIHITWNLNKLWKMCMIFEFFFFFMNHMKYPHI